jgi:hypothetical protein
MVAALVGGTLASLGMGGVAAAADDDQGQNEDCKRNGKKCKRDNQCCSLNCVDGICQSCPGFLATPVGGGDPFCACSVFCVFSCETCAVVGGSTCVTTSECNDRPFGCARPC